MNEKLTDITVLLDRSGSMASCKSDTIGGFNHFLEEQQKAEGDALFTLVQFDSQDPFEVLHHGAKIGDVVPMTDKTFVPRARTPLLDAVGRTIVDTGERLSKLDEGERPSKVVFVIITDGLENASREYKSDRIKAMVTEQTDQWKWEFVFIGANLDAIGEGHLIGVAAPNAANYDQTPQATKAAYAAVSSNLAGMRSGARASLSFTADQRSKMSRRRPS